MGLGNHQESALPSLPIVAGADTDMLSGAELLTLHFLTICPFLIV